ncbi:PREDICTED: pineal opsin-like, partial [Poecilia mexicana]|uniref:pineal opsin-like n=1 Tax=Poecilia mexicana TaxID=48701 RepID=UPI00072EB92A
LPSRVSVSDWLFCLSSSSSDKRQTSSHRKPEHQNGSRHPGSLLIPLLSSLQVSGINASLSRKREQRVLFMVVIMVICYLLCWMPYGIMALLATFGPPGLVTPEASIIPSVLAKTSTVINPVIYVFMNKQFYRCFRALLHCQAPRRGSSLKSSSKAATKAVKGVVVTGPRRTDDLLFMVASLGQPAATVPQLDPSCEPTIDLTKAPSSYNQPVVVVSLVAHFEG